MHKVLPQHRSQLFNLVRCRVSFAALRMLEDQANQAHNNSRMPLTVNWTCSGVFTAQFGLPCWHRLVDVLNTNGTIEMRSIDPHWYLTKIPLPQREEDLRRILDPAVIPRRRQRTRQDASVRRDRSHDELLPVRRIQASVTALPELQSSAESQLPPQQGLIERRQPTPSKCSICGQSGHRFNSAHCPLRVRN